MSDRSGPIIPRPLTAFTLFEAVERLKQCQTVFRGDIAAQLHAYGDRLSRELAVEWPDSGLIRADGVDPGATTGDRAVVLRLAGRGGREQGLEIGRAGQPLVRLAAVFNQEGRERPGWHDWFELVLETGQGTALLLTKAWTYGELIAAGAPESERLGRKLVQFERRSDPDLPLAERGLAAEADLIEGDAATVYDLVAAATRQALKSQSIASVGVFPPLAAVIVARPDPGSPLRDLIDLAEFQKPDGLYHGFAVASAGGLNRSDLAHFAQRVLELQIIRDQARLQARSNLTAAGVALNAAMQLFGVGVAFGTEIAAATYGFGPWLGGSLAALPYTLTGVGLIGGGLVPITKGRAWVAAMGVAVAWSVGVAALTMRNPRLVDPIQAQMPGFHAIDPAKEIALINTRTLVAADEKVIPPLENILMRLRADFLKTGRKTDENYRDFNAGEKKRQDAVSLAEVALDKAKSSFRTDGAALTRIEHEWHAALETHWTRSLAEGIVFGLTALVGAIGPIYLGLWMKDRKGVHRDALAGEQERRRLKERTQALSGSESSQRAEVAHILGAMRAYYREMRLSSGSPTEKIAAEIELIFADLTEVVEQSVAGFRAARPSVKPRSRSMSSPRR